MLVKEQKAVVQPPPDIGAALNYVANHDVKAAAYVGLTEAGESTIHSLSHTVAEHSGVLACQSMVRTYPETFTRANFATRRMAMGANHKPARHYTAQYETIGLAVVGKMFGVSEKHDQPLVDVLSFTASAGDSNAPLNSIQIFDGLLKGLAIKDMNLPGYKHRDGATTAHNTRLQSLVDQGFVEAVDDPNEFRIKDPVYTGSMPFDRLHPETRAVYQVLRAAKQLDPARAWTAQQLTDMAVKLLLIDAHLAPKLKHSLVRAASTSSPKYFPGAVEKRDWVLRQYRVAESFQDVAADLVHATRELGSASPREIKSAADIAVDIYRDPTTIARIIMRGVKNSPYVN